MQDVVLAEIEVRGVVDVALHHEVEDVIGQKRPVLECARAGEDRAPRAFRRMRVGGDRNPGLCCFVHRPFQLFERMGCRPACPAAAGREDFDPVDAGLEALLYCRAQERFVGGLGAFLDSVPFGSRGLAVGDGRPRDEKPWAWHESFVDGVAKIDVFVARASQRSHRGEAVLEQGARAIGPPKRAERGPCFVAAKMGGDVNVAVDEARKHGVATEVDDLRPLGRLAGAERRDFVALYNNDSAKVCVSLTVDGEAGADGKRRQEQELNHGFTSLGPPYYRM